MQRIKIDTTLRLVLICTTLSVAWIGLSDPLLASWLHLPDQARNLQTLKGLALTAVNAVLLFVLLRRALQARREAEQLRAVWNDVLERIAAGAPLAQTLDHIAQVVTQETGCRCDIRTAAVDAAEPDQAVVWVRDLCGPNGVKLGTLSLRPGAKREPAPALQPLLTKAADLALIAIQRAAEGEQLRLLESAVNHTEEGIMVAAANFADGGPRIVFVNPGWLRLFGAQHTAVLGAPAARFLGQSLTPKVPPTVRPALLAAKPAAGSSLHHRPDGSTVTVEWTVAPIPNAAGELTHFVSVNRDVTERREREAELERYRLMSDSAETIVFFVDAKTDRIVDANAAALAAYGYAREELLQSSIWRLRPDGQRPRAHEQLLSRGSGQVETVHVRSNGQQFPALVTVAAPRGEEDSLFLVVVQDLTFQKQLEAIQELLHKIDHQILAKQELDEILQFVCEQLVALFGYPLAYIGLKEPDGTVRAAAMAGVGRIRTEGLAVLWAPEPNGPTGRAIATGDVQTTRLTPDPRHETMPELSHLYGAWPCVSLPLQTEDEVVGALSLYKYADQDFDESMVQHLRQFANQVALSILAARAQAQIQLQTQALEAAANAILIADAEGRVLWVNRAWTIMTGFAPEDVIGRVRNPVYIDPTLAGTPDADWPVLLAKGPWHIARETRRKDGSLFYMDQTITPVRTGEGCVTHLVSIAQDVTERKQQEEHLRFLALHDPLTGLPNRLALQEGLEQMIAKSSPQRLGAILLLDLDHFKFINDTLGDAGGDELLIMLTRLLQQSLRTGDLLCRFAGDQFAVLLGTITPDAARTRAEALRLAVSELRFRGRGQTFNISASVGVAMLDGSLDASAVKALVNAALAAAKEAGKNQVVLYETEADRPTDLAEENRLAALIKDALQEDRLCLHFQPVVALETGDVHHYEALIRLRQPDGTILPPGAFLSAAERFRLMPTIDRWVLERGLDLLRRRPELHLFLNLSGQSLSDEALLLETECRLRASGDVAARLAIEVTETTAVRDMERLQRWMTQLKALGCRFALDDFGIGFSSFAYLRALPADYIKLDGSFIRNLDTDPTNRSLVETMFTAARTLGKVVVAEWVENEAIAQVLREIGVQYGQGYRWGKPLPDLPDQ